jgi:hypothetical protein
MTGVQLNTSHMPKASSIGCCVNTSHLSTIRKILLSRCFVVTNDSGDARLLFFINRYERLTQPIAQESCSHSISAHY